MSSASGNSPALVSVLRERGSAPTGRTGYFRFLSLNRSMKTNSVIVLCCAALLSACGSDATGPVVASGALSFRYTGGLPGKLDAGVFSVNGAPHLDAAGRPHPAPWAAAGTHPLEGPLVPVGSKFAIVAFSPLGSSEGDLVALTIPRVSAPTTVAIDANCTAVGCARGLLLLGVDPRAPHEGLDGSCDLLAGTVQIVSVSGGRIRGSFSATGQCTTSLQNGPFHEITVQEGEFDVGVSDAFRSGLEIWS